MANISVVISNIRNVMRQDRGISGDAQRLEQLGWMLFLKIIDDKDQELEILHDNYGSVILKNFNGGIGHLIRKVLLVMSYWILLIVLLKITKVFLHL